eukprot:CAMPEP_0170174990 /NCGR_PEP_ID=MMETSP0040_2-20121228/8154_1 /TAXON_ID=641309 /ORGANISM="Lotharella oceanica, Strain CCMP622" /LENGTH=119 /DNA_ID=CAMNT_0010416833 /DNA_START=46 /DNA_END=405 /DNA_ORIENTATION=+
MPRFVHRLVRSVRRVRVLDSSKFGACVQVRSFGAGHFLPKDEIEPRVLDCIKNFRDVEATKVSVDSDFSKDLGLDSLDTVELVLAFEDEFNIEIPEAQAESITNAKQAIEYISQTPFAK